MLATCNSCTGGPPTLDTDTAHTTHTALNSQEKPYAGIEGIPYEKTGGCESESRDRLRRKHV